MLRHVPVFSSYHDVHTPSRHHAPQAAPMTTVAASPDRTAAGTAAALTIATVSPETNMIVAVR